MHEERILLSSLRFLSGHRTKDARKERCSPPSLYYPHKCYLQVELHGRRGEISHVTVVTLGEVYVMFQYSHLYSWVIV